MSVKPVKVVCHRGACRVAPENTFASADVAIKAGAHTIEFDVHQSRDGVFYILHDPTVDRTTDGTGALKDLDSATIDRLDAGSWFGPQFKGERVPRLDDFLAWIKGRASIYLEMKHGNMAELAALVRRHGFEKNSFFFSLEANLRAELHAAAPDFKKMIRLYETTPDRARADHHASVFEVRVRDLTEDLIAACRRERLELMVYHDRPDPEAFRTIIAAGADYVNLDHPQIFLEVQREVLGSVSPA